MKRGAPLDSPCPHTPTPTAHRMPSSFLPSLSSVPVSPSPRYRRLGSSSHASAPSTRRIMDKFFSMRQPPRATILLLAFSPVILIGLAILHDNQLQKIIATTHATLMQDGALEATVARRTRQLHAVSEARAAEAAVPPPPVAAAPTAAESEAKSRGAIRKMKLGKQSASNCVGRGKEAKSLLMVFMGHSGSSAVISELRMHSRVKIYREPEAVDHREKENNSTAALLFAHQFFRETIAEGKIPGFKMRPRHIRADPEGWRNFAREHGTRIIWNYRSNLIKQAVGEYSYKKLGDQAVVEGLRSEAEVKKRCEKGVGCKFSIDDIDFFHYTLRDLVHSDNLISSAAHLISAGRTPEEPRLCVHELPYEDYLYDRQGSMESLYEFLDLKYEETKPTRFKATKDNMCEVVENWNALCRNLYACNSWRRMMDDEVNGCTCNEMGSETKYCSTEL